MNTFLLAAAIALPAVVHANVIYDFVGVPSNLGPPQSFELAIFDFLQLDPGDSVIYKCLQLSSSLNCGDGVVFINDAGNPEVQFNASDGRGYAYSFPNGAFGKAGSYFTKGFNDPNLNNGYLTVRALGSPGPPSDVPEPASVLLVLTSLAVGGALRFSRWKVRIYEPANKGRGIRS